MASITDYPDRLRAVLAALGKPLPPQVTASLGDGRPAATGSWRVRLTAAAGGVHADGKLAVWRRPTTPTSTAIRRTSSR